MTREEKNMIEQRLRQLEEDHMQQQERLRQEAEQKALVSPVSSLQYAIENTGPVKQIFECKIVIIFLPINLNICFGPYESAHNICFG